MMLTSGNQPVDAWCDNMLIFFLLKHVHSLIVDVGGVVDDINAVSHAHLDRIASSCVSTKPYAQLMGFIDASCCFLVREVAVLC